MTARITLMLRKTRGHRPRLQSKEVLQRELHDSRIQSTSDLAEATAVQRVHEFRGIHTETVRQIESLRPELHSLIFANLETSRKCRVEFPRSRSRNGVESGIPECTRSGIRECRRIEEVP